MTAPRADAPRRRGRAIARVGAALVVVAILAAVALVASGSLGGSPTPSIARGAPVLVDETEASGLAHTYGGGSTFLTGGGVAVLDCDDDGLPDLYLAGGEGPAALFRNRSTVGGALRFERFPDPVTDLAGVTGAYPVDIDGDGHGDLAVLRVGESVLLRGLGGCRFERANEAWGFVAPDAWTTAFSATWEDPSGLPTIALGHYVTLDAAHEPTYGCEPNALYRPVGGGGYGPPIAIEPGYCTLSILFSSWDGSGRRDLRVTNDRHYYTDGFDQLWRIEPGALPRAYTADDGWVSMQIWGMGIASQDLTGDGLPEVFLTSQGDNKLQTLLTGPGQPTYRDIALKRGVTLTRPYTGGDVLPSTAWHAEFDDVNNDGFADLFVAKGNVSAEPDFATRDPSNLLLGQPDGTFAEGAMEAGIVSFERGRGASLADLNLDGMPDLVEIFLDAPVAVWRNVGSGSAAAPAAMGHWLALRLRQPGGNVDAIGAVIEVRVGEARLWREVVVGGGHIGGRLGPVHLGLGDATRVEIRVTWPDGEAGPWFPVTADQFAVLERGATAAQPWTPGGG